MALGRIVVILFFGVLFIVLGAALMDEDFVAFADTSAVAAPVLLFGFVFLFGSPFLGRLWARRTLKKKERFETERLRNIIRQNRSDLYVRLKKTIRYNENDEIMHDGSDGVIAEFLDKNRWDDRYVSLKEARLLVWAVLAEDQL